MMKITSIKEANLFFRRAETGGDFDKTSFCGLVRLADNEGINEEDAFILDLRKSTSNFGAIASFDGGIKLTGDFIKRNQTYHVNELLLSPIWNRVTMDGVSIIRFIKAFPETNQWAVYGVASTEPLERNDITLPKEDFWLEINGSKKSLSDPLLSTNGMGLASVLREPIWKNAGDGELYSMETCLSSLWPDLDTFNHILADVGDGVISEKEATDKLKSSTEFYEVLSLHRDKKYLHYLSELRKRGLMGNLGPRPKSDIERMRLASTEIIKDMHHQDQGRRPSIRD